MPLRSTVVGRVCDMHQSASSSTPQATSGKPLLSFSRWRKRLLAAERGDGWLTECVDEGRFLAVNQELVDALAGELRRVAGSAPILEVCAGSGELARSLKTAGVDVVATDVAPMDSGQVLCLSAEEALRRHRPSVVLGAFVPFDAGVDEAVLSWSSVNHYVVLNARIGGVCGSSALWQATGWTAKPLNSAQPWMLTRHDVGLELCHHANCSRQPALMQHGEAWLLSRASVAPTERARL